MNMKVLADYWFSDVWGGTCGIVIGEDSLTGERKAYIGVADGYSQEADKQHILEGGQKFSPSLLEGILGLLKSQKKK